MFLESRPGLTGNPPNSQEIGCMESLSVQVDLYSIALFGVAAGFQALRPASEWLLLYLPSLYVCGLEGSSKLRTEG